MGQQKKVTGALRRGFDAALSAVLPPRSLLTDEVLSESGVEAELFGTVTFLDAPWCGRCGFPFEFDSGLDTDCADCLAEPPVFDRCRSAFIYDDDSRKLVLDFKHGGRTDGLKAFGAHLSRAGRELWPDAHMLVPVPLHWTRRVSRKFNQSALLARQVARFNGLPVRTDCLRRVKKTPPQGFKSLAGRQKNVQAAFDVPEGKRSAIDGRNIVLVDDVYTTGSTLSACARALKKAGAARVEAVTLARVVRTHATPT